MLSPSFRAVLRLPLFLVPFLWAFLSSVPAKAAGEDGPVTVWHAYRGGEERALVELARRYETRFGTPIQLLAIPFDAYRSKLESAIPHGHGPDVFIEAHERLGSYLRQQIVAPLTEAFPEEDGPKFEASAVQAITVDGARYGVPLSTKCLAMYVNTQLLPSGPTSLQELIRLRATLPSSVYPLAYESHTTYFHAAFIHAFGASLLTPDGRFGFTGPGAVQSLALVRNLEQSKVIPEEPSGAVVKNLFVNGQAVAAISGPWFASEIGNNVPYRVVPLPPIDAQGGHLLRPLLTVEAAYVTPQGAKRSSAQAFARWLGQEESSKVRALEGRQVVARMAAWNDPALSSDTTLVAFRRAAAAAIPMPIAPVMRSTWEPIDRAIGKVLRGDATPEQAVEQAERAFEEATRPAPKPASPTPALVALGVGLLVLAGAMVKRGLDPNFRKEWQASKPAYAYVTHAALAVVALVLLPLTAGALTSFFAGSRDHLYFVGLANYIDILTARGGHLLRTGSFYMTLAVTVFWTLANLLFHVSFGLILGLVLSRPTMRWRGVYRVLLILPWAVPSYVTALAWKGMFHRQFGAVNALLAYVGAEPISWFSRFSTAFAANLATNVWLGFPFMMVVTLGALTSIPKEVLEAAEVDGATRGQKFRLVTLPLLLPALLPSVVLGAVWTFNMFNVVCLVSGGEPDGATDILVTEAYRWAFTRDAQLGYAAAYAVLIFALLAGMTRLSRRLEGPKGAAA